MEVAVAMDGGRHGGRISYTWHSLGYNFFENEMWNNRGRRDFGEKDFSFRFFERKSADKSAYEIDVTLAVIIE
jgi:hypothetical protein